MKFFIVVVFFAFLAAANSHPHGDPRLEERTIKYFDQYGTELEGFFVVQRNNGHKRPGLIVAHQFLGLSNFEKEQARNYARKGYAVLATDVYGKGIRFSRTDANEINTAFGVAGSLLGNSELLRARIKAGVQALKIQSKVDSKRIAALGFCFGGSTVLELARSANNDVKGVISFHGNLFTTKAADGDISNKKILVLHGRDDPTVLPAEVENFQTEMTQYGADFQVISFSQTLHAFTDPNVQEIIDTVPALAGVAAYSPRSSKRAFEYADQFLEEVL